MSDNPHRPFSTERDAELARIISKRVNERVTSQLAAVMRLHANGKNGKCIACGEIYPCATWMVAAGETG